MLCLELLNGGTCTLAALLTIQCQHHRHRLCTGAADDLERLANRSAGGDDIIDDDDTPTERSADDVAAFAMILRFFPIERVRDVATVMLGERHGGGRHE